MSGAPAEIDEVARALVAKYLAPEQALTIVDQRLLPSVDEVREILDEGRALLLPGYLGPAMTGLAREALGEQVAGRLASLRARLVQQLSRAKAPNPIEVASGFLADLPALHDAVAADIEAALAADPAATSVDEIAVCYPGVNAITTFRIAHALHLRGAPLIPRIMTEIAHQRTGIDLHPGATVGRAFFIDHGTGVVVGETARIGDRVRIYQGVTLGALAVPSGPKAPRSGARRHPTLEDDVVVYAGATILGGDTVIGRGAVIGGNAWVTAPVAPGAVVAGEHRRRDTDRG